MMRIAFTRLTALALVIGLGPVLVALLAMTAHADSPANTETGGFRCAMDGETLALSCTPAPWIDPLRPRTKALVIFIQYFNENPHPLSRCWDTWPVDTVPVWADSLIQPTTNPAEFLPGSLNHYFWTMSGGRHYVYGTYYPQVVTLDYWEGWYRDHGTLADMCREVIQKIDPYVNFADYDVEPADGVVDMVFMEIRSPVPWGWGGASYLGKEDILTNDFRGSTRIVLDGCYPGSGTFANAVNHMGALQGITHEYLHQVYVPRSLTPGNPYAFPGDTWHLNYLAVYGLMDGNGGATTMSAFEREWLGWAQPTLVNETTLGFALPDAATTGFSAKILLDPAEPREYFLVENRQRVYYTELTQGDGIGSLECCNNELESTGIIIYHVDRRDLPGEYPGAVRHSVDVEAADGMFDPVTGLPDPIGGLDDLDAPDAPDCRADTVGTDSFLPGYPGFTPTTNPNSNGYAYVEPFGPWRQTRSTGIRVQNIRFDPTDPTHTRMLVDIIINRPPPGSAPPGTSSAGASSAR